MIISFQQFFLVLKNLNIFYQFIIFLQKIVYFKLNHNQMDFEFLSSYQI